jgi:hypothetical protein
MATNEPFGFDPDDLDRFFPGAGEQLRGALGQLGRLLNGSGQRAGWSGPSEEFGRRPRSSPVLDTTGDTGDGVWVIYIVNGDGGAQVEQIYATELDALRANKHSTDSNRRVRFVPYGIAVSVLDEPEVVPETETT